MEELGDELMVDITDPRQVQSVRRRHDCGARANGAPCLQPTTLLDLINNTLLRNLVRVLRKQV